MIAEELFTPDPEKIKHEVEVPRAQGRTRPYYESLTNQKDLFVQSIHNQKRRQVLILPPEGNKVVSLRALNVPNPEASHERLEEV